MAVAKWAMPNVQEHATNYTLGGSSTEALLNFRRMTQYNEAVHLAALVRALIKGREGRSRVVFASLVTANFFCVLLQHRNRARVDKVLAYRARLAYGAQAFRIRGASAGQATPADS